MMPIVALQVVRWPGNRNIRSGNHTIFYSGLENRIYEYKIDMLNNSKHKRVIFIINTAIEIKYIIIMAI